MTEDKEDASPNRGVTFNGDMTINTGSHLVGQAHLKLSFYNVSYTCKQTNSKVLKILNDTCGELNSGRLTAILGPSGAGKTSMLNVLSGFKSGRVTGSIQLNDEQRNLMEFRKMCSYIPQDFAILDLLTVQETLKVSTDLKLPKGTSTAEKHEIIDDILDILNMQKCRNTLVLHLSGGERKRLSIGVELVTNPPVMFFDEPTSGLDSVASLQVMNYLRRLASDGRIIVCVVHQPSSRLMKLFDDILIMSRGEVLYSGARQDMIAFFDKAGFTCPHYYNPADFALEVGSEEPNEKILHLIQSNKDRYCTAEKVFRKNSSIDEKPNMLLLSSPEFIDLSTASTPVIQQHNQTVIRPKEQVNFWRQLYVLIARSLRSMSRNLIAVQLRVVMHIVVAVLLGIVYWDIGNDASKVLSNSSCLFFVVMFVFFGNSMPSILLCPQDTAVFIREYLNGWYSLKAYYAAKIIADIPMQFVCPTLFITIVYYMTGQPNDLGRFAMCWGIGLLTAIIGHFIGLVFGSTFNLQMSVFLVPSVTIPFMIFSGFFIRIHELALFLQPLCDISFFRYTMEGLLQAIYGYKRDDLVCNIDFCYFKSPQKFLREMDMLEQRYGLDLVVLLVWIVALKVLLYLSFVWRIKKSQ